MSTIAFDTKTYILMKCLDPAVEGRDAGVGALDDLISIADASSASMTKAHADALMRQADAIVAAYARHKALADEHLG